MNPLIIQFVFGFLLSGAGIILFSLVINSHNWRRTMEDFRILHHNKKYWAAWVCLLLGLFIMIAPIFSFIRF